MACRADTSPGSMATAVWTPPSIRAPDQTRASGRWRCRAMARSHGRLLYGSHGVPRRGLARLQADGSLDPSFDPGLGVAHADSPGVHGLAIQTDGKILAAGWFACFNGVRRTHLARLNPDGSLDATLSAHIECSGWGGGLSRVLVQPDGQVLIAGDPGSVNDRPFNALPGSMATTSLPRPFSHCLTSTAARTGMPAKP